MSRAGPFTEEPCFSSSLQTNLPEIIWLKNKNPSEKKKAKEQTVPD